MKKLYLIRHAKSSWDDPALGDFDRPLNHRGEKDAPRMGKRLKERGVVPDIMITSPAKRAQDTCKFIAKELHFSKEKIKKEEKLYHADADQLLEIIQHLPDLRDEEEVVLLFGHNPGLTELANNLLNEFIDNIPTCGVVGTQFKIKKWSEARFGSGKMIFFDFPKNKD